MESYITVKKSSHFEYEDRKSVFIGQAMPVNNEADAIAFVNSVKKRYPDARHHVYAYVLRENSSMRFTDDGEPQGTAGMPVLDAIRKNGCTDTVIVVVRYFGGVLLGTGGLVKAYTSAAVGALRSAEIIEYDIYSLLEIKVSYSDYQKIVSQLSSFGFREDNTVYSDSVEITGKIKATSLEALSSELVSITSGRVSITKIGEKYDF